MKTPLPIYTGFVCFVFFLTVGASFPFLMGIVEDYLFQEPDPWPLLTRHIIDLKEAFLIINITLGSLCLAASAFLAVKAADKEEIYRKLSLLHLVVMTLLLLQVLTLALATALPMIPIIELNI